MRSNTILSILAFGAAVTYSLPLDSQTTVQRRNPQDPSSEMFEAEMKAQNDMQQQTTEQEFAQKMNNGAWKTASGAASDKIQRRQTGMSAALHGLTATAAAPGTLNADSGMQEMAKTDNGLDLVAKRFPQDVGSTM